MCHSNTTALFTGPTWLQKYDNHCYTAHANKVHQISAGSVLYKVRCLCANISLKHLGLKLWLKPCWFWSNYTCIWYCRKVSEIHRQAPNKLWKIQFWYRSILGFSFTQIILANYLGRYKIIQNNNNSVVNGKGLLL